MRRGHLLAAAARHGRARRPAGARVVRARRQRPALPRLPVRLARRRRRGPLPGQLDLHPRAGRRGRAHPELPLVEPVDGPGPDEGLRRHGVLLQPGRRALELATRISWSWPPRELAQLGLAEAARSSAATSPACRSPTPSTTRPTPTTSTPSAPGSRDRNLQQVGRNGLHRYNNSDHSMLTALRAVENIQQGAAPRPLGGQRRVGLPRGGRQGGAALPRPVEGPGRGALTRSFASGTRELALRRPSVSGRHGGRPILVVDDDPTLRAMITRSFPARAHVLAVAAARGDRPRDGRPVRRRLLDAALGPGPAGYEVCRELRDRHNACRSSCSPRSTPRPTPSTGSRPAPTTT